MVIRPSLRHAMWLSLLHAIGAVVIYAAGMPLAGMLVIQILILLSMIHYLLRDALLLYPGSWREISFDHGRVLVVTKGDSGFSGQIACKTTVSPYFIVLSVGLEGCRLPVTRTIFPDSLGAGEFRELCVCLRFSQ